MDLFSAFLFCYWKKFLLNSVDKIWIVNILYLSTSREAMIRENIKIYPDHDELSLAVAKYFAKIAIKSIHISGRFSVALSGGSTPKPLYQALVSLEGDNVIDWTKVDLFWGDERCVPPDHPDSNYRMVKENLLQYISIPEENVYRVPSELDPSMAAFSYEEILRVYFSGVWPRFDLVLLGMGEDGHTASLFPGSPGLNEEQRWFIANHSPEMAQWRLTLTINSINAARHIAVLVVGDSKADMLHTVLDDENSPVEKPIQNIVPVEGNMRWFVDQAAAGKLLQDSL